MAEKPEVIRRRMAETRASLTRKLDSLQHSVDAKVQNLKTTVNGLSSVPKQVERHPWAMVGGAAAIGFCLGRLLVRQKELSAAGSESHLQLLPSSPDGTVGSNGNGVTREASAASPGTSWLSRVAHEFESEIDRVKRLAIGASMGIVRDGLTQSAPPEVARELGDVIDSITLKLGGEPLHEPLPRQTERSDDSAGRIEGSRRSTNSSGGPHHADL
jgi:ElaB/YqjD/DUF883 family membrane-anchored ribosome-binding protein